MVYGKWRWRLWYVKSGKMKRTLHWSSKWFLPHIHKWSAKCVLQLFGLEQIFLQFSFENLLFEILQYFIALNQISFWHWCRNKEEKKSSFEPRNQIPWMTAAIFISFIIANPFHRLFACLWFMFSFEWSACICVSVWATCAQYWNWIVHHFFLNAHCR